MHENASITCAIAETEMSFSIVLSMQPRTGGGGGASREDLIGGIAKDMEDRWVGGWVGGWVSGHEWMRHETYPMLPRYPLVRSFVLLNMSDRLSSSEQLFRFSMIFVLPVCLF